MTRLDEKISDKGVVNLEYNFHDIWKMWWGHDSYGIKVVALVTTLGLFNWALILVPNKDSRACYLPNGRAWNGLYWQDYSFFLVQKVRLRVRWRSKLLGLPVLLEQGWRDEVCRGQTEAERVFSTGKGHCWTVWDIPRDLGGHFHRMSRCGQVARRSQIGKIIFGDSSWYYHI